MNGLTVNGLSAFNGDASLGGNNLVGAGKLGIGTLSPGYSLDVENGSINTNLNYAVNGDFGTLNYCLASGGSSAATDRWLPCLTSVTLYYQTVADGGTALAQQSMLNFDGSSIVATAGTGRTNVGLSSVGTPGTYAYPSSLTTDINGRVTLVTAGSGFTSGSNSNGSWVKDPTGHIHQWGSVAISNVTVLFPTSFTTTSGLVVTLGSGRLGAGSPPTYSSLTTLSFYLGVAGGSDAADWIADGN
jgi:hypothetical protein